MIKRKVSKILLSSLIVVFMSLSLISCASIRGSVHSSDNDKGNITGTDKFIKERLGRFEKGDAK